MSAVMVGGSRTIAGVPPELEQRLDAIIERGLRVLIGDAIGFDRAVQTYLHDRAYPVVEVFCTHGVCRNNVGAWPIRAVPFTGPARGRAFYTAKDDAMVAEADFGLFAWDGESPGTIRNIRALVGRGRPSVVFVSGPDTLTTVRTPADVAVLGQPPARPTAPTDALPLYPPDDCAPDLRSDERRRRFPA